MYFPYVYGRRYELLALKSMLTAGRPLQLLLPVIEPVCEDTADLLKCVEAYENKSQPLAVVVNPTRYELEDRRAAAKWFRAIEPRINSAGNVIPMLLCHPQSKPDAVTAFLEKFPGRRVAFAHSNSTLSDAEVQRLATNPLVRYQLILNGKITATQLGLIPRHQRVSISDNFTKLQRNADYSGIELFTDKHKSFAADSVGFGDYAAIGSALSVGGGPAAAVAIHATFKHPVAGDIWIEHFVSDDKVKNAGSPAQKFIQAARKLVGAVSNRPAEFGSNCALDQYAAKVAAAASPGLGKNKELQAVHHFCVMLDVLSGKL